MKKENKLLIFISISMLLFTGCTYKIAELTVMSTKNASISKSKGVQTEGEALYILGIGWNLQDPLNNALENAGPQYDLLIDAEVSYQELPFMVKIIVKGKAVSSKNLKSSLGEEGYDEWCRANRIFNPYKQAEEIQN